MTDLADLLIRPSIWAAVGAALGVYTFGEGEQADLIEFGDFVEAAREWGRSERAKLGL